MIEANKSFLEDESPALMKLFSAEIEVVPVLFSTNLTKLFPFCLTPPRLQNVHCLKSPLMVEKHCQQSFDLFEKATDPGGKIIFFLN